MVLNDKQKQIGKDNYNDAVRITRRQMIAGTAVIPTAAAMYFGYEKLQGDPVRVGIIGTGNQGCQAHIAQSNPEYVRFVAFSDIRPSSQVRARDEFNKIYGESASEITHHEDYRELLERDDVELVIIAVPLKFHAEMTIDALSKGKHVLCEKLMAKTVTECKQMIRAAEKHDRYLAIGHQRHYSYLYDNAVHLIESGLLGEIRHIDAWWHRNFAYPRGDGWRPGVPAADREIDPRKYGYESIDQLLQWRIDPEMGGGLMVELGSHQVDAGTIFLGHKPPKAISGTGVTSYFNETLKKQHGIDNKWGTFDHIFLHFEFGKDANNAVLSYSSISTNQFDGYGEQVNGSLATMILTNEASAYLYREPRHTGDHPAQDTRVGISTEVEWQGHVVGEPSADAASTTAWATSGGKADTLTSRGYREEQEHLAWLIRKFGAPSKSGEHQPRCGGKMGLNDAVVALVANMAMERKERIELKDDWFRVESNAAPETDLA